MANQSASKPRRAHTAQRSGTAHAVKPAVLVTGVQGRLALLVARVLQNQPDVRVVAVDSVPLTEPLPGIETHAVELREQPMRDVLRETGATTVVHLAQDGEETQPTVRGNILSTMELLAACADTAVHRVVLRSSTLVYGARPGLPLYLDESAEIDPTALDGLLQDYAEIERFADGFARKQQDMALVVLRLANVVGGGVSSSFARYLRQHAPRMMLGFDPLIQVLHAEDAAAVLALSTLADEARGIFNIAAPDPLPLSQAVVLAGRRAVPLAEPLFAPPGPLRTLSQSLVGQLPFSPSYLKYACIASTQRAADVLGFVPRYASHDALREFAASNA